MNQESQSEEIDLMQLFGMIKEFFRKFLKLIVDAVLFYKKKWILFFVIGLVAGGLGFFMDNFKGKKNNFVQEIVIEPKYGSIEYLYDYFEDLEENFKDDDYLNTLGLSTELVQNIKKIVIEPIIDPLDVLIKIQDKELFAETYNEKLLEEKKYRNFYKRHKLTILFEKEDESNTKISQSVLNFLKSNEYFTTIKDLQLKQTYIGLEENRKSLKFINDYLVNLSKNPSKEKSQFIFATESETPTISSLLKRKNELISVISSQEKLLELGKQVFVIVEDTGVIIKRKKLVKTFTLSLPLIFFGLLSVLFFMKYLSRSVFNFVNEKQQ